MSRKNKYLELVGELEKKLCGLEQDTLLPSEQTLADEFAVSKPTLRRALQAFVDKGQLRKVNGVGVVVVKVPRTMSRELIFVCRDIVFFAKTLNSFGIRAAGLNYYISIVPLAGSVQNQELTIASVIARNPAGVVIYADPQQNRLSAFRDLAASGIPALYLMRLPEGINDNLLEFGNADGMSEIVERFYADGCRKIAFYGGSGGNPAAALEREQGFLAGMKRCRLKPRQELICRKGASTEEHEAFLTLFEDEKTCPDAVCAVNDYKVGHLIKTLQKRGVDVSKIRFSGFDHTSLSEFISQPLLTVEPPMGEMGTVAADMLIRQVENPQFGFTHNKLKAKVIQLNG